MYTTHVHMPDVKTLVRPALTKMFVVVQEIYRHAPNLLYGDVIFPAATWGEWYGGTYIQSERRAYVCDGANNPPPNCIPDMDMAIDKCKTLIDIQPKALMGVAKVDLNLCYSYNDFTCGTCLKACPVGALKTGLWARPIVDADACVGCGLCERVCIRYPHAIRVETVPRERGGQNDE